MKLLLIDGLNVVRRVYEANPAPDSPEKMEGVIKSAFGSFKRALAEHKPTHVLAPFDHGGHTWRHDLYPAYREKRKPMPEILQKAIPGFCEKQLRQELGIPTVSVPGVEADDVIGMVAGCWVKHYPDQPVVVLSTDKDLAALAELGVIVWDHFKGEQRDEAWIQAKFGVSASQLHDYLALMGDSVDGVPGIDRIGAVAARELLATYGNLEAILNADVKGARGGHLKAGAEMGRLSRQLVGFKTDLTLGLSFKDLRLYS